jgi:hypothetical protein
VAVKLTADLIEAFAGMFLSPRYDSPQPTPPFHREMWALYCSDSPAVAVAAPRNHAKSTGGTHDFILATALFRAEPYIILVGSSEDMAIEHLSDIANELLENEELRSEFGISTFETQQKTDIVVRCQDGYLFRIIARGAEQKIRGRKWMGRRPGLIVFDDIEDDEQVESRDRRLKFRRWFFRACKQALRDGGKIRGHGTILHEDSLLARLMKDKTWQTKCWRAHAAFDDFTEILWPEKFPEKRLRGIRQEFIEQGDAAGYSQEYLNDPFDNEDQYLRRDDFVKMEDEDHDSTKVICAAADLATSMAQSADRTSITVGGKDLGNFLHVVDQRKGKWPSDVIVEQMFAVQQMWTPDVFFVEGGAIWNTLAPMIYKEMQERDIWINFQPVMPTKDKASRGRPFQRRHRAKSMKFDKEAPWYEEYEAELLRFTGVGQAVRDDQFDSTALLVLGFETISNVEKDDLMSEDEQEFQQLSREFRGGGGRNTVTGY